MTREEAEQALIDAGAAGDDAFPLMGAAFACAIHDNPDRDLVVARALIDQAATRLEARLARRSTQAAIAETLAGDLGFSGDTATYDDLDNADILSVLARRQGLPVALGIIYIDVARRCGLGVRGLDFPGHFLLRLETPGGPMAIDPFNGGEPVEAAELTRRALVAGLPPDVAGRHDRLMTPVTDRTVLTRLQNNILVRAQRGGDDARTEGAALRCAWLNPSDHRFWLYVAGAREARGALAGALQALGRARNLDPGAARFAEAARIRLRSKLN
ncbi:MAG TPA: transglutaminase family protein [Caulobacteraceae bacterium]|nr:transglutaminase family protein [Caulobacteraceae bacterium]